MIYIKRLCFCIVVFLSLLTMVITILLLMITFPIWALIYYVITGNDPLNEEVIEFPIQTLFTDFLNWYYEKFGP